jgi:hypothetical protein
MRIPIRLLSITYFMVFTLNANLTIAQIKFGPKIGLSYSELPNNTEYIIYQHIYNGYHLGVLAEFRLFEHLFLQPGVLISTKGSKYTVGNNSAGSTTGFSNFELSSLNVDIPLDLAYMFDMHSYKLLLITGPQLGYGLVGKWTTSFGTSSNVHFGDGPNDDLKPFDFGLNFGGGFQVARIQFSLLYYMGLKSLSTLTPPIKEQKYKVFSISIAYLFGNDNRFYKDYKSRYLRKHSQNKTHWKKHY